jgi:NADH-quinone oxidoreductase subunit I
MEDNNKSYFGGIKFGLKSLLTGLGVTFREYLTKKVTEQYPENRKTTLHVSPRHRGRLIMPQDAEGNNKCIACKLCEMACPNGTIKVVQKTIETEDGKKKRVLDDYIYDLGECMFCELCVNACPHEAIKFVNDFENSTFGRDKLVLHLDKEKFEPVLPNIEDGGTPLEIGVFNTKIK